MNALVDNDVFQTSETLNTVDFLVNSSNLRIQTVSLSLLSMVASAESGVEYLLRPNDAIRSLCSMATNVEVNSVAHRFALAFVHKLSYHGDLPAQLLDNKVDAWVLEFVDRYSPKKTHSFFPIFYTALAYNLLTSPACQDKVSKFVNRFAPFCAKLLGFFKKELPVASYYNILELFKYLMVDKEVYFRDLVIESKAPDTLREYASSLISMFKSRF